MHATDDNKPAPRPNKKQIEVSADARQKRIEVAVAGERCWRCFFVKCGCSPGKGLNGGTP